MSGQAELCADTTVRQVIPRFATKLAHLHVSVVSYRARSFEAYHRGNSDSSHWLPTLTYMLVHKLLKLVKGGIAFDSLFTNSVDDFISQLPGHVNLPYACAPIAQDEERARARRLDPFNGPGPADLRSGIYGATQPGRWAADRRPIKLF